MSEELGSLQIRYARLCERLMPETPKYPSQRELQTTPQHDGSAHVEIVSGTYHYVVTERGSELERSVAKDKDELFYWLMSDVTFSIACDFEVNRRIAGQDSRRQLFDKNVELLGRLDQNWATRKELEYAEVLRNHPFVDEA
jgi:hypothetical protein